MKTADCRRIRTAVAHLLTIALATTNIGAAKGGKPGKPVEPQSEPHHYSITVLEPTSELPVFWREDDMITGRIDDAGDDLLKVNQNFAHGINPYANLDNLAALYGIGGCDDEDWATCFPALVEGTVLVPARGEPGLELDFTAFSRTGKKNAWYNLIVDAVLPGEDASWDLYNLPVGESAAMALTTWTLALGTGPVEKGCAAYGDFRGSVIVTVTRLPDPVP